MSIELKPFLHEAEVAVAGGLVLRLTIDFGVIDRIEGLLGFGIDQAIGKLSTSVPMAVKFLWAMTRKHHSDLTLDQIAGVVYSKDDGPAVMAVLGRLVRDVFNFGEPGAEGEQSRPPRKRSAGASKGSSVNGARRASGRQTSGAKRRARS